MYNKALENHPLLLIFNNDYVIISNEDYTKIIKILKKFNKINLLF